MKSGNLATDIFLTKTIFSCCFLACLFDVKFVIMVPTVQDTIVLCVQKFTWQICGINILQKNDQLKNDCSAFNELGMNVHA